MTIEETLLRAYNQLQDRFWDKSIPFGREQKAAYIKLQLLAHELNSRKIR